jgi:hypothetical protein
VKIELDLSNHAGLLRLRAEHQRILEVLDVAIRGFESTEKKGGLNGHTKKTRPEVLSKPLPPPRNPDADDLFDQLGSRFAVKDLVALGTLNRNKAKHRVKKWEREGRIRLHERGDVRKPSTYDKI